VRRRERLADEVLKASGEEGEVFVTERRGHGRDLAGALAARARLVIAWGGDGTVNEVGSALAFGPTPLGIVPAGSGNGLALELAVSLHPENAIKDALGAAARPIDVGEVDGRLFFNAAGIGFDAHIARCFDQEGSGRRGLLTYVRVTARELLTYRARTYRVNGRVVRGALLITFANSGQFGNGVRIAPAASLDDGRLDLVVFEETSRVATLCGLPRLLRGKVDRVRGWSMVRVEEATIESDEAMVYHLDGEPVMGGPRLAARVHPRALRVCVR
jgi:YegS/Rv2252/BmrU family lipid kinase